jgi:hypothetical protein
MSPALIPVLRLRRRAAACGWRLASTTPTLHGRAYRYERDADLDGGWAHVRPGRYDCPPDEYVPLRVSVNAPEGFLVVEHIDERQAVALVRALLGWTDEDAPCSPRSKALVPVGAGRTVAP